jgi:hypothetical protein
LPIDLPMMIAKAQMDPGWFAGLGTGPQMLGGQIFPGNPAAHEFNYLDAAPPGTDLVSNMIAGLPMAMASYKLDTAPLKYKNKNTLFIHWFDTREPKEEYDDIIGIDRYKSVKKPGFGFMQGIKDIIKQAIDINAKSIVFQPSDVPQKKLMHAGHDNSMRTIVDMLGLKGKPTPNSVANQSPRITKGMELFEIPVNQLQRWIETPEGRKDIANILRGIK